MCDHITLYRPNRVKLKRLAGFFLLKISNRYDGDSGHCVGWKAGLVLYTIKTIKVSLLFSRYYLWESRCNQELGNWKWKQNFCFAAPLFFSFWEDITTMSWYSIFSHFICLCCISLCFFTSVNWGLSPNRILKPHRILNLPSLNLIFISGNQEIWVQIRCRLTCGHFAQRPRWSPRLHLKPPPAAIAGKFFVFNPSWLAKIKYLIIWHAGLQIVNTVKLV